MAGGSSAPAGLMPMLATSGSVPDAPGWAFEFTWDGVRSLADVGPDHLHLVGGNQGSITTSYPELEVLPALVKRRVLLDGKIVALDACGRPNLSRLQHRMNLHRPSPAMQRRVPVAYYVFDLLRLDDRCTLLLPYRQRREMLEELDLSAGPVVLTPYFLNADGQAVLDIAAQYGLPGVVAKRADSIYRPGRRSRCWVQTALRRTQEVVIGGWVPGKHGPADLLGSLLVGVPTEAGLRYAGQVSLGLTEAARHGLRDRLAELGQRMSPFVDEVPRQTARQAHWVAPELFGEVSYRRWTAHGRLGHPTWAGLRRAKHPAAVQGPVLLGTAISTPAISTPAAISTPEITMPEITMPEIKAPAADARGRFDEGELDDALRRARAEITALRVQIAPHFLYNALSAIAALVRTDPPRARELLMDFAGFTRYSFRSATEFTTLDEELENIERYLALEQARLDERLQVTIQVAPQVMPVVLPFLALQLVVENAVRNGIEEIPGGGTVAISAVDDGAYCLITVAADGPGTPGDADLGDVDERLRRAFGADYRLVTDLVHGSGSTVHLRVPRTRAEPHHP